MRKEHRAEHSSPDSQPHGPREPPAGCGTPGRTSSPLSWEGNLTAPCGGPGGHSAHGHHARIRNSSLTDTDSDGSQVSDRDRDRRQGPRSRSGRVSVPARVTLQTRLHADLHVRPRVWPGGQVPHGVACVARGRRARRLGKEWVGGCHGPPGSELGPRDRTRSPRGGGGGPERAPRPPGRQRLPGMESATPRPRPRPGKQRPLQPRGGAHAGAKDSGRRRGGPWRTPRRPPARVTSPPQRPGAAAPEAAVVMATRAPAIGPARPHYVAPGARGTDGSRAPAPPRPPPPDAAGANRAPTARARRVCGRGRGPGRTPPPRLATLVTLDVA